MRRSITVAAAVALLACASSASAATYSFNVALNSASQCASHLPCDPGASGTASITMNDSTNQVCWTVTTSGIGTAGIGGISEGAAGQPASPAPVVAFTSLPSGCSLSGAIAVMVRCPRQFNVTVRDLSFPAGAIRGQLGTTCST